MTSPVPSIAVTELPEQAFLLDVREQDEWDAGHATAARHIPMAQIPERLAELPEDAEIYVICRSGGRSYRATQYLNQNGWDAYNVSGGMRAWADAGFPLASAVAEAEPEVI